MPRTGQALPYGRQWVDEADLAAVAEALKSDFLTTGPWVEAFEAALCGTTGANAAVAVNSGTAALHCGYYAAGLQEGDEVITTPLTFAATANAARYLGAKVTFVDVQPDSGLIDPSLVAEAASERTKVIAPVDYAGCPADYEQLGAIAARNGARVVADAAHSLGATYRGRRVGTLADLTSLSSHPVKPVTTGEGGALLGNDQDLIQRAREFRTHGIVRDPGKMHRNEGPWYYEQHSLGFNYRLTDIQCALGVSQLGKLDRFLARRRQIAERYTKDLAGSGLELPSHFEDRESGWHLYVVRVPEASRRRALFDKLRELGLGVQVHYVPVYWHPYYQELGYVRGTCPNAEDYYHRCISLPIFPRMTESDLDFAVETTLEAVSNTL